VASVGAPEQLFSRPADSFVAGFFANANLLAVQEHKLLAEGNARVRCAGSEIYCPTTAGADDGVVLAVRRRSLRRFAVPGALRIAGVVSEMLLFGDEQEIPLQCPALGRVVAMIDSRDCAGLALGMELELFASAGEAVLVPLV
jgi:ABC-type proline/glycine betaine transport system ATPase subunit